MTNDLKLPEPIVRAIQNRDEVYYKGDCDFSVTELISPPRIRYLKARHVEHIQVDASERIFALFGDIIHVILQNSGHGYLVEERFFWNFENVRISGKIDVYHVEIRKLSDYKICSRHVVTDGAKPEWEAQLNMNALLMRRNGFKVDSAEIVAIFRDWSKMAAGRNRDYPKRQVQILPVELWSDDRTEAYILERIKAHQVLGLPPVCSERERWRKPDRWALMKKGRKKAVKLYDDRQQAEDMAGWENKQVEPFTPHFVEPRHGEDIRCLNYCEVAPYCSYFQELMQEKI